MVCSPTVPTPKAPFPTMRLFCNKSVYPRAASGLATHIVARQSSGGAWFEVSLLMGGDRRERRSRNGVFPHRAYTHRTFPHDASALQ